VCERENEKERMRERERERESFVLVYLDTIDVKVVSPNISHLYNCKVLV